MKLDEMDKVDSTLSIRFVKNEKRRKNIRTKGKRNKARKS